MSNAMQRIFTNIMLVTLLLSVSVAAFANTEQGHTQQVIPTAHYVACDIPDQANLDVDLDSHIGVTLLQAIQPIPPVEALNYVTSLNNRPFSQASQRGPPRYLI